MHPSIPLWITLIVIGISIAVPVLVWLVFAQLARRSARALVVPSTLFVGLWLVLAFTLAARGFFAGGDTDAVPRIAYAVLPLMIGYLAYLTIPSVRTIADEIPLHRTIGFQVYRAAGFIFLATWMMGALPGSFALPAGLGDMAIGLSAPLVASLVRRGAANARVAAMLWNVLGIADLVVAVTMGVLTSPGPLHQPALGPTNFAITMMPLVLIPIIPVPLSLVAHLVDLHRLAGRAQPMALGFGRAG